MAYPATVRQLLISCPGDVPHDDLTIIRKRIHLWNFTYGRKFDTVLLPLSWSENAAAELGTSPQAIIDDQLVDDCDLCIAIFANRLGSPTGGEPSGTAYEIRRFMDRGLYPAVLRCRRLVDPRSVDRQQWEDLDTYMKSIHLQGLIFEYHTEVELIDCVDRILHRFTTRSPSRGTTASAPQQHETAEVVAPATNEPDVLPPEPNAAALSVRVISVPANSPDHAEGPAIEDDRFLSVSNVGTIPARDVHLAIEAPSGTEAPWLLATSENTFQLKRLDPGQQRRVRIIAGRSSAAKALFLLSWTDERGEQAVRGLLELD